MSSLNDVCYEQIRDNYWYGLFGDFKIMVDKNTGFFNASHLCEETGKKFKDWLQMDESKDLINYYKNKLNDKVMYAVTDDDVKGIYLYDPFLLSFTCWLSFPFYMKVNKIVCKNMFKSSIAF